MAPLIRPGDRILVARAATEQIGFGDIVLFRRNREFVVHRVLGKWRKTEAIYFLERGDMGLTFGLVSADRTIGRVVLVERGDKVLDLTSHTSRLIAIFITAWLRMSSGFVQMLKRSKNRTVKYTGRVISGLLPLISNMLIRSALTIMVLSGIFKVKHRLVEEI
jgi:hypothetical protein